jgi:hypothetical protein
MYIAQIPLRMCGKVTIYTIFSPFGTEIQVMLFGWYIMKRVVKHMVCKHCEWETGGE